MVENIKFSFVDKIIGEQFVDDQNTLFRARILVSSWFIFFVALLLFGTITALLPMTEQARLAGVSLASIISLSLLFMLLVFRRSGNYVLFAHLSIVIGYLGITSSVFMASSATNAPSIGLFYIVPLLAVFFLGWKNGSIWVGVTFMTLLLLFTWEKLNLPFLGFYDQSVLLATSLSSMSLGMLGVLGMVITYEISNKKLRIERDKEYEYLEFLAHHDLLTGLSNRAHFEEQAEKLVENLGMGEMGGKLALVYLDLDGFKPVNDEYGHKAGDLVLKTIAERILSLLGAKGFAARHGGDEFIILLPGVKNRDEVVRFVGILREEFKAPIQFEENQLKVDCSMGIAMFPRDAQDIATLIRHADIAMYYAKSNKLGCISYKDVPASS